MTPPDEHPHLIIGPPTSIKIKRWGRGKKTTFVEEPKDQPPDLVNHEQARSLQALYDKEAPPLEHVVVRCNRTTKKWELYKDDKPYKELNALILINVTFSCQWSKGEKRMNCGKMVDGAFTGYASGDVLPVSTPLSVPTDGLIMLGFDPGSGVFFDKKTCHELKGSGYLILKEGCSSEYVNADAIGPEAGA